LQPETATPAAASLYADYIPDQIRQFYIHFRLNWPGTNWVGTNWQGSGVYASFAPATNVGDLLEGWSAVSMDDGSNGAWLLLSSPDPVSAAGVQTTSIPWGDWGELVYFYFRDVITTNNAFAYFVVDTNIYATTNLIPGFYTNLYPKNGRWPGYFGQSFSNYPNNMVTNLPLLTYGTPTPWLLQYGFTTNLTNAEFLDADNSGMLNWMDYQANTNPTNAASKFHTTGVTLGVDGRWDITFTSALYRTYQVQASPDLYNWRIVQDGIPGTGTNITVVDTGYVPVSQTFYRVLVY
jgi:hypothetical protein